MYRLLLMLSLLLSPAVAAAETEWPALIEGAIELYNEIGRDPLPYLGRAEMESLLEGDVVRIRRRETRGGDRNSDDAHHRVVGYLLVDQPQVNVWMTALDPEFAGNPILTDYRIERDDQGWSRWYQHVSLPWPVTDRHWVIDIDKGLEVFQASQGFIWEHRWDLSPDGAALAARVVADGKVNGLTPDKVEKAIYLPVNYGGWVMVRLAPAKTLIAYHVTTDVGGSIPESWIATFAMSQLGKLLGQVARDSADVTRLFAPGRDVIYDGGGVPIDVSRTRSPE